jgi:hypothetical protein
MARVARHDTKTLLNRERELREELKRIRQQRRAAEGAARQARLARVGALAEKFGIAHVPDTVLAAEFKRIAAAHPAPAATESPADDAINTAEASGGEAQTPAGDAAAPAAPEAEHAVETAEAGTERKRWPWK